MSLTACRPTTSDARLPRPHCVRHAHRRHLSRRLGTNRLLATSKTAAESSLHRIEYKLCLLVYKSSLGASVHHQHADTCGWCLAVVHAACSHKGELRRSMHQPSHRQQGVLSRRPQSVEQSADRTQDNYLFTGNFQTPSENMSFSQGFSGGARVFAAQGKRLCCRPRQSGSSVIRVCLRVSDIGV